MKKYLVRIDKYYYASTKLEEAALELIKKRFNNTLVNESELEAFRNALSFRLGFLNDQYKRAKPLIVGNIMTSLTPKSIFIGTSTENDLLQLQAVEVAHFFGKEASHEV